MEKVNSEVFEHKFGSFEPSIIDLDQKRFIELGLSSLSRGKAPFGNFFDYK